MLGAKSLGDTFCVVGFVQAFIVKADGESPDRGRALPLHQGDHQRGVHAAR